MATWELSTLKHGDFGQNFPNKSLGAFHTPFLLLPSDWNFTMKTNTGEEEELARS
jgi:hypothetical protein